VNTDVRVLDNQRTEEDTIRSIAGVKIGDTLELDTLGSDHEQHAHAAGHPGRHRRDGTRRRDPLTSAPASSR
jgi:hypothetical protein